MSGWMIDLRSATRALMRKPSFTVVVVVVLGLGIGASAAIFSVIDSVALQPLPWPDPDRIVSFNEERADLPGGRSRGAFSLDNVREFRERSQAFDGVAAYWNDGFIVTGREQPERLEGSKVTPDLFRVLRSSAALGRTFTHDEVDAGEERLAVLAHRTWQRVFGTDPQAIGRTIQLNGEPYTVIGVMAPDFGFPDRSIELWAPLVWKPSTDPREVREIMLPVIGRLATGVSVEQAQSEGDRLLGELVRERRARRRAAPAGDRVDRGAPGPEGGPGERQIVRRGPGPADGAQGSGPVGPGGGTVERRIVRGGPEGGEGAAPAGPESADDGAGERRVVRRARGEDSGGSTKPGASAPPSGGPSNEQTDAQVAVEPPPEPEPHLGLRTLLDERLEPVRPTMRLLAGAVFLVMLIACANVANLILTRNLTRRRELATRVALGAGRAGLARLLLVESLLLGLAGAGLGLALAWGGVRLIRRFDPGSVPRLGDIGIHPPVVGFTLLLALATGLLFGLLPAAVTSFRRLGGSLGRDASPATGGRPTQGLLRAGIVIAEVALALVLLIGAGLFANSFLTLSRVDPGYDPDQVLTAHVSPPPAQYPAGPARTAFYDGLLERVGSLPGVESAGLINFLPPFQGRVVLSLAIEGRPRSNDPSESPMQGDLRVVSPGYFEAMRQPVLEGRPFDSRDRPGAPPAVLVSAGLARRFFPDGRVVGERLMGFGEIVGVVGDIKPQGLDSEPQPTFYVPLHQAPPMLDQVFRRMALVVRAPDPEGLLPALRTQLANLDPNVPLEDARPMTTRLAETMAMPRFYAAVLSVFAALALVLAVLGVYGVLSFAVSQEARQTGIRMALGARREQVVRRTLLRGLAVTAIGIVVGLGAAVALRGVVAGLLFGIAPTDPATFAALSLVLLLAAAVACWVPARRAAGADPSNALRHE